MNGIFAFRTCADVRLDLLHFLSFDEKKSAVEEVVLGLFFATLR